MEADDLETLCVLGRGAYGIVDKMRHKQSGTIMAVKVIPIAEKDTLYVLYEITQVVSKRTCSNIFIENNRNC